MYIVVELQTTNGVTTSITEAYESEALAYQKFYQILSFAVVSEVDVHSALVLNQYGAVLRTDTFTHIKIEE